MHELSVLASQGGVSVEYTLVTKICYYRVNRKMQFFSHLREKTRKLTMKSQNAHSTLC